MQPISTGGRPGHKLALAWEVIKERIKEKGRSLIIKDSA
jgi:hypothetical protein